MINKEVKKELLERWQDRVRWIASQDFSLSENKEEKNARIKRAQDDYRFFVNTYFKHIAPEECSQFQVDAANYIKNNPDAKDLEEWARGLAKSSHISLLIPLWLKIQEPKQINVMVLTSKSEDMAIRLLSDLQAELQYNQGFTRDFDEQVKEGSWGKGEFRTLDGCLFIAVGRGQSPRGIKERSRRPDYIVIDDIDDDELVRNPKRVKKVFEWCLTALLGAMDAGRGRFIMVGNRIGKISVLTMMAERPCIRHRIVNILDKKGLPSWKENHSLQEIRKLREFMGERHFQKEYMNNPITEGTIFLQKHIRYAKMLDLKHYKTLVCYTDPSFKNSATSDFKATVLVGKTNTGYFHVIKIFADQTSVSTMISWHYQIMNYIAGRVPVLYYMEANFLQDLLLDAFKQAGEQNGLHIPIRGDKRKKDDKFARIEAMQPMFENGLIVFNEKLKGDPNMKIMEDQLLMFEKGSTTNDDAPDALEGAVWLLSQRTRTSNTNYIIRQRESRKF